MAVALDLSFRRIRGCTSATFLLSYSCPVRLLARVLTDVCFLLSIVGCALKMGLVKYKYRLESNFRQFRGHTGPTFFVTHRTVSMIGYDDVRVSYQQTNVQSRISAE